jgi:hypothetical protein
MSQQTGSGRHTAGSSSAPRRYTPVGFRNPALDATFEHSRRSRKLWNSAINCQAHVVAKLLTLTITASYHIAPGPAGMKLPKPEGTISAGSVAISISVTVRRNLWKSIRQVNVPNAGHDEEERRQLERERATARYWERQENWRRERSPQKGRTQVFLVGQ